MKRRTFIRETGKYFAGISILRNLSLAKGRRAGKAATTTDILGPFYRPGSPIRVNINPPGFAGEILDLSGTIFKEDGRAPFGNCMVEIWQCQPNRIYDNVSDDFHYRGTQKVTAAGKYHFITTQPVPYPAGPNSPVLRPAHIHLRISGEKQQDLITQIYIAGDPNIPIDPCASAPESSNRIVNITRDSLGQKTIIFDIVMAKEFKPSDDVFRKLSGVYPMNDNIAIEFYRDGDLLLMKWNGQIREGLKYMGNNEFLGGSGHSAKFELLSNGDVKAKLHFVTVLKKEFNLEGIKAFKY